MRRISRPTKLFREDERGTVAIIFALTALIAVGTVGSAIDVGRFIATKQRLQIAVDTAAIAGASLPATANSNRVTAASKIFAANIEGTNIAGVTPTINATNSGVTVTASFRETSIIMQLLGNEAVDLHATTTARSQVQNGGVVCMLALNPSTTDGLHLQGINKVSSENCWVWVNSDNPTSINAVGASSGTAQGFCTVGGVTGADHFSPSPYPGCEAMADPFYAKFASYNPPGVNNCTFTNKQYNNGTHTMTPGTYCGNTVIKPQAIVTMQPGLYVFKDGDLTVQAQSELKGNGVTLFFYGQNTSMSIKGGGSVDLKAPATGDLAGFVIADRKLDWYDASIRETEITGGGSIKIEGILYAPQWRINVSGNGTLNQDSKFFAMIADHFYMEGSGQIHVKSDAAGAGLPDIMPKIKNGPLLLQ